MSTVTAFLDKINSQNPPFKGLIRYNEVMSEHTTFKVGGPAEVLIRPEGDCFPEFSSILLESARNEGIPVFILGGGANIVVSDQGIRGIVLDTTAYSGARDAFDMQVSDSRAEEKLYFCAGTTMDDAVDYAASMGLSGLEFLSGMPGCLGGALWMNARCYEQEMADRVREVQLLEGGTVLTAVIDKKEFAYKKSPFQTRHCLILGMSFALQKQEKAHILERMNKYRKDREEKGHYRFPCAGSVFKNNPAFGKSTGLLLDELGCKGLTIGDAQLAPWHGNIIINKGKASAADILALVEALEERARTELGLTLEREILFI